MNESNLFSRQYRHLFHTRGLRLPNLGLHSCGSSKCRANRTELDVRVNDRRVTVLGLNIIRLARVSTASTTPNTRGRSILISGVCRVQPQHIDRMIVPERHYKHVALRQRGSHLVETTLILEGSSVAKCFLLGIAPSIGDRITLVSGDGGLRVGVALAALHVETLDVGNCGAGADELSDDGNFLVCVDGLAGAVERLVTLAVALDCKC